jgi:lipoprotein signal peptidase
MRKVHLLIAVAVVVLDRIAKLSIERNLPLHDSIPVIPGFFRITHVQNQGAAFGLFADSPSEWKVALLIMFSVIALVIVSALLWKNSHSMTTTGIGLAHWEICGIGSLRVASPTFFSSTSGNINGQPSTLPTARS